MHRSPVQSQMPLKKEGTEEWVRGRCDYWRKKHRECNAAGFKERGRGDFPGGPMAKKQPGVGIYTVLQGIYSQQR